MSGIKGVVLLTRFDFIEEKYGREALKQFFDKIKLEDKGPLQQPVGISKDYPELVLKAVDETLLNEHFDGDTSNFLKLGHWNAHHLMPRYFQIYVDKQNPDGFLVQMMRMRHLLIGLGEMKVNELGPHDYWLHINYGQPYLESIKLSEVGFLEEGCRMCGARDLTFTETRANDMSVEFEIKWNQ